MEFSNRFNGYVYGSIVWYGLQKEIIKMKTKKTSSKKSVGYRSAKGTPRARPNYRNLPTQYRTHVNARTKAETKHLQYCPTRCQQKKILSQEELEKGKKTYDGKQCSACGYKR